MQWDRIADVNINRLDESLKIVEDIIRFNLEHMPLLHAIRKIRRDFRAVKESLPWSRIILARSSERDPGRRPSFDRQHNIEAETILIANITRAKESARTLEEVLKEYDVLASRHMKELRFCLYDVEKRIFCRLQRRFSPRLCVILDENKITPRNAGRIVRVLEDNGATMIQLRGKMLSDVDFLRTAKVIRRSLRKKNTKFIINDRVDIAMACCADGVHLGQQDMPAHVARSLLGEGFILGVSAHTLRQARQAVKAGADYLGVGSVYATTTKRDAVVRGLGLVKKICQAVKIPVIGVGGITQRNYRAVLRAGAAGVAVSRSVFEGNIGKNLRALTQNA